MPSLRDTQDHFTRALFTGDAADMESLVEGGALTASARLDIYRNNVLVNYQNALRDTYPALVRLVGDEFFNGAARRFARAHSSFSGDLHDYGEAFSTFLRDFAPARALPYLPDVARLEWAMHRVFHAADAAALAPGDFDGLDAGRLPQLRFALHPAARLLTSEFPVMRIWQISQPDAAVPDAEVDLGEGGQRVLVIRRHFSVHLESLTPAEHAALASLDDGQILGDAVDAALALDPAFDLSTFLSRHVMGGSFATLQQ